MFWDACKKWVMTLTDGVTNPQLQIHSSDEHIIMMCDSTLKDPCFYYVAGFIQVYSVTPEKSQDLRVCLGSTRLLVLISSLAFLWQDNRHVWRLLHWRSAVLFPFGSDWLLQLCVLPAERREAPVTSGTPRGEPDSIKQHILYCGVIKYRYLF